MKNLLLGVAIAGVFALSASAAAAEVVPGHTYGDVARVISATPIHKRVAFPRRDCRIEEVTRIEERRRLRPEAGYSPARDEGIGAGTVLGAIVGGVIGHQFGGTTGARDVATGAGALIGGLVGNSIENDAQDGYRTAGREVHVERAPAIREVERCEEIADARDRVVGYDVRYEYNGREFHVRLPHDPGPQMPVNVEVRPPMARDPYSGPRTPHYRGTF
jgi:uncharacterized protein YcfJ